MAFRDIFKNLGWGGLYSDTTSRDKNPIETTKQIETPKPIVETLGDKIRSIKTPHWCRISRIENDYDNYYGNNDTYRRDSYYTRSRYENSSYEYKVALNIDGSYLFQPMGSLTTSNSIPGYGIGVINIDNSRIFVKSVTLNLSISENRDSDMTFYDVKVSDTIVSRTYKTLHNIDSNPSIGIKNHDYRNISIPKKEYLRSRRTELNINEILNDFIRNIRSQIENNISEEIKQNNRQLSIIKQVDDFTKNITNDVIKDCFSHVIDVIGDDNFNILYKDHFYKISFKFGAKKSDNGVIFKMDDKSTNIFYELTDAISKIKGYHICDISIEFLSSGFVIKVTPIIDKEDEELVQNDTWDLNYNPDTGNIDIITRDAHRRAQYNWDRRREEFNRQEYGFGYDNL